MKGFSDAVFEPNRAAFHTKTAYSLLGDEGGVKKLDWPVDGFVLLFAIQFLMCKVLDKT